MLLQSSLIASSTANFGGSSRSGKSPGLACDISQFWQCLQERLQPTVPMDNAPVPGKKWYNGFFSIGSTCTDIGFAYTML